MPQQTTKSFLAAKLNKAKAAHAKHKDDTTTLSSGGRLPAGIEHGIAELVDCYIGQYKDGKLKGEPFYRAVGVVKMPKRHDGIPIEGLQTTFGPVPLCDTPDSGGKRKTFEDNWAYMLAHLRGLGVDTSDENLPATLESDVLPALKTAGVHFAFRTWKGQPTDAFPDPRTNEQWGEAVQYEGTDSASEVDDQTETVDVDVVEDDTDAGDGADDTDEGTEVAGDDELDSLLSLANEGDADAVARLTEIAEENGIDAGPLESWQEVVDLIRAAGGEEAGEPWKPAKGEVYQWTPPKAKKAINIEITAVFEGQETVNGRDDSGVVRKSIPWAKLLRVR